MTDPPFWASRMRIQTYFVTSQVPFRFVLMISFHSSSDKSNGLCTLPMRKHLTFRLKFEAHTLNSLQPSSYKSAKWYKLFLSNITEQQNEEQTMSTELCPSVRIRRIDILKKQTSTKISKLCNYPKHVNQKTGIIVVSAKINTLNSSDYNSLIHFSFRPLVLLQNFLQSEVQTSFLPIIVA